jgi:hypothetical protein
LRYSAHSHRQMSMLLGCPRIPQRRDQITAALIIRSRPVAPTGAWGTGVVPTAAKLAVRRSDQSCHPTTDRAPTISSTRHRFLVRQVSPLRDAGANAARDAGQTLPFGLPDQSLHRRCWEARASLPVNGDLDPARAPPGVADPAAARYLRPEEGAAEEPRRAARCDQDRS